VYCSEVVKQGGAVNESNSSTALWQLLLIICIPLAVLLVCLVYLMREVHKDKGFYRVGQLMMVAVGLEKQEKEQDPSPPKPRVQVVDMIAPEDPLQQQLIDLAPYHAAR
jgi:hypothetical protein